MAEETADAAGVWRDEPPSGPEANGTLRLRPVRPRTVPLLLEVLDESVLAVVSGEFVHVGSGEDTIVSKGDGWAAAGRFARSRRDPESLLRDARAGRSRHPVVRGEAWW
ncbi:hypothetical protein H180DRAFT_00237 [Streptomyces sp. WMMB 322]|nr:hypothetical protein H180DRAFT_00237 [Streptomyces sp. WMMB 322]